MSDLLNKTIRLGQTVCVFYMKDYTSITRQSSTRRGVRVLTTNSGNTASTPERHRPYIRTLSFENLKFFPVRF